MEVSASALGLLLWCKNYYFLSLLPLSKLLAYWYIVVRYSYCEGFIYGICVQLTREAVVNMYFDRIGIGFFALQILEPSFKQHLFISMHVRQMSKE